jgi:tripartite-type tricarboxylate transporter receptor subunit TctC
VIRTLAILIFVSVTCPPALAQSYPVKPLKIIVSTSAGGVTDLAARILGTHLTAKSGQPVVIENRPGASGNIAMDAVAKAAPDGYTLGVANTGNIVINPYLMRHMPYDPLNDLVPVAAIGTAFLVMNADVPATTLAEFIAYAKAQPDKVSYASAGVGTTVDLAAHEFNRRSGLKLWDFPASRRRLGSRCLLPAQPRRRLSISSTVMCAISPAMPTQRRCSRPISSTRRS